ncbi:MAG: hypothetical protein ACREU9_05185 [Gammaproteobacteria bacterium]
MSIRYWFGRFARSKGLRIFNYAWAIITLIIFGLMLYGPPKPEARNAASKNAPIASEPLARESAGAGTK